MKNAKEKLNKFYNWRDEYFLSQGVEPWKEAPIVDEQSAKARIKEILTKDPAPKWISTWNKLDYYEILKKSREIFDPEHQYSDWCFLHKQANTEGRTDFITPWQSWSDNSSESENNYFTARITLSWEQGDPRLERYRDKIKKGIIPKTYMICILVPGLLGWAPYIVPLEIDMEELELRFLDLKYGCPPLLVTDMCRDQVGTLKINGEWCVKWIYLTDQISKLTNL